MIFKLKSLFSQLGLESPHGKQVAFPFPFSGFGTKVGQPGKFLCRFAQAAPRCSSTIPSLSFYLGASGRLLWVESEWKTHAWLKLRNLTGRGLLHRQLAEIPSGCGLSFVSRFAEVTFYSHANMVHLLLVQPEEEGEALAPFRSASLRRDPRQRGPKFGMPQS